MFAYKNVGYSLQWRHDELAGISNHQAHDCCINRLFTRRYKKHQRSASLAFVWGIHQWPVNSPHKGPVARKIFPFDDIIMFPIPVNKPLITFHYGNSGKGFTFILMIIHYHMRGNQRECSMLFFIVEVIYCGHNVWTYGSVTNLYLSLVVNSF